MTVARVTADLTCLLGLFEPSLLHAVLASYLEKDPDDVQAAALGCDFVKGVVQEQQRAVLGLVGEHYAQVSLFLRAELALSHDKWERLPHILSFEFKDGRPSF